MHDFKFQFEEKLDKFAKPTSKLETWIPLDRDPGLSEEEKHSVLYGDAAESLHIVKPAFLYVDYKSGLNYVPSDQLDYYYLLAKLKKSPYLVLLGEQKKSLTMQRHLVENHKMSDKNTYYLDLYFGPYFGGLTPKCFLFEKVSLSKIPNTMVLFKET